MNKKNLQEKMIFSWFFLLMRPSSIEKGEKGARPETVSITNLPFRICYPTLYLYHKSINETILFFIFLDNHIIFHYNWFMDAKRFFVVLMVVILVGSCTQGPSRQKVFDQGNPYFISKASVGDAFGRVTFGQSLQCRLVVERNPKIHVASKAAVRLKISFSEDRVIQLYSYPDVPQEEGEKEIKCQFSWSDSLAEENVKRFKGKLSVIFPIQPGSFGDPTVLSNEIEVTFKVTRK